MMNPWKSRLVATAVFLILVAAFAFIMHQQIVNASTDTAIIDAKDSKLGLACGKIVGFGLGAIWLWPILLRSVRK